MSIGFRNNTRKLIDAQKQGPCVDCGLSFAPGIMRFVRRPGVENAGPPIARLKDHSWPTVKAEIAKCDLLCANCHYKRMRIAGLSPSSNLVPLVKEYTPAHAKAVRVAQGWDPNKDPDLQALHERWSEEDAAAHDVAVVIASTPADEAPDAEAGGIPRSDPRWLL